MFVKGLSEKMTFCNIYAESRHFRKRRGFGAVAVLAAVLLAAVPLGVKYFKADPEAGLTGEFLCSANRTQLRKLYRIEGAARTSGSFENFLETKDAEPYAKCPNGGIYTLYQTKGGKYLVLCSLHTQQAVTSEDQEALADRKARP